jgi:hypothetical protein
LWLVLYTFNQQCGYKRKKHSETAMIAGMAAGIKKLPQVMHPGKGNQSLKDYYSFCEE